MTEPYDGGGYLPDALSLAVNATPEPELVGAQDKGRMCGRCRRQHSRCTDLACACCQGEPLPPPY